MAKTSYDFPMPDYFWGQKAGSSRSKGQHVAVHLCLQFVLANRQLICHQIINMSFLFPSLSLAHFLFLLHTSLLYLPENNWLISVHLRRPHPGLPVSDSTLPTPITSSSSADSRLSSSMNPSLRLGVHTNRKYITHRTVVGGGPIHSHR